MGSAQAFNELARALHHARHREALQLIEDLLVTLPDSGSLKRQRDLCLTAIEQAEDHARRADELAAQRAASELIRVEANLFDLDQQMYCNAPIAGLRALGFSWLLDAASTAFSRRGDAPALIRFFADDGCATLVVCFSARMRARPVRLLACVSELTAGTCLLTHRDDELALNSNAQVTVLTLPRTASLTELIARHAGRVAVQLREAPATRITPLATLGDCDRVWRLIAGS